jgi:type II secretion system protein N
MQIIGYGVFVLCLFYGFLLWQFPYEELRKEIIRNCGENLPFNLTIQKIGPSFPLNLKIHNARVQSGSLFLEVPDLKIQPDLWGILWGRTEYRFGDARNSGWLAGEYRLINNENTLKISIKEIAVKASSPKEFSLTIVLSGEANLKWVGENLQEGNGQVWLLLKKSDLRLTEDHRPPEILSLFDSVRAEIQMKDGNVILKKLEASGRDLNRSFQGEFQLFNPRKGTLPDFGLLFQMIPRP